MFHGQNRWRVTVMKKMKKKILKSALTRDRKGMIHRRLLRGVRHPPPTHERDLVSQASERVTVVAGLIDRGEYWKEDDLLTVYERGKRKGS